MEDVSKNEGRTVLFVSHNMGIVNQLCNKGILLNKGGILVNDSIRKCVNEYMELTNGLNSSNLYSASEHMTIKKTNFVKEFFTSKNGQINQDFGFEESVELNFKFVINEKVSGLLFGIGLSDKNFNRVATIVESINSFRKSEDGIYLGKAILPSCIIAPNSYSFVVGLWIKNGQAYDIVENICPIKIHDTNSSMIDFEGADYGSIVLNYSWA